MGYCDLHVLLPVLILNLRIRGQWRHGTDVSGTPVTVGSQYPYDGAGHYAPSPQAARRAEPWGA